LFPQDLLELAALPQVGVDAASGAAKQPVDGGLVVEGDVMEGGEQRRVGASLAQALRALQPQWQMRLDAELVDGRREACGAIEGGGLVPLAHPELVLLGRQSHLLDGMDGTEALVAPGGGELAAHARVGLLRNGDVAVGMPQDDHLASPGSRT
jgi:hypothetical protein